MFMPRHAMPVTLSESDRQELERWVSAHRTPQQVAQRCRIVVAAAQGRRDKDIAEDMKINVKTVALWRQRFLNEGPDCLWEVAVGRGRKPTFTADKVEEVINATLQTRPKGATHWSCRTMAEKQGVSKATVNRIWQSHGLQPHRVKGFKLSRDSEVPGETYRRGRPLPQPSGESTGALRGREESDSGIGSHTTGIAFEKGPLRHHDP